MHNCTHWLRPCKASLPPHLGSYIYTRAPLVSQDRRRLFVTPVFFFWLRYLRLAVSNRCHRHRRGKINSLFATYCLSYLLLLRNEKVDSDPCMYCCPREHTIQVLSQLLTGKYCKIVYVPETHILNFVRRC